MSKQISTLRRWLLSSPPAEWTLNRLREMLIGAIRQGKVPRHVAFVMDGNRRYARSHRIETVEGHNLGFEALARVLEVCYKSGVTHVTIYAFSIENFKRSKYEVDALMEMAKIKLTQLSQHGELLDRYGARIRILGQRSLLTPDVLEAMDRAVKMTEHNDRTVLNVCFPYTSRDEITTSIRHTVEEWCQPVNSQGNSKGNRRKVFTEDRIRRNLERQEHLERIEEQDMESVEPEPDMSATEQLKKAITTESERSQTSLNDRNHTLDEEDEDEDEDSSSRHISPSSSTTTLPNEILSSSATSSPPTSYHSSPKSAPQPLTSKSSSNTQTFSSTSLLPNPETITAETISAHLFAPDDPPLDLLIRTSGVERLSDFMLWQCHEDTRIVFLDVLWPEFDLWTFLPVLWEWQWWARKVEQQHREVDVLGLPNGGHSIKAA